MKKIEYFKRTKCRPGKKFLVAVGPKRLRDQFESNFMQLGILIKKSDSIESNIFLLICIQLTSSESTLIKLDSIFFLGD